MKLLLITLLMVATAEARNLRVKTVPSSTVERLKKLYPDQSDAFIQERLKNATTAFQKWRSFPPYYYELLTRLKRTQVKKVNARPGLCAGDPHLENFGFIYAQKPLFTINDLDDVSECALDADIMRLLIGYRLLGASSVSGFIAAYQEGLKGTEAPYPEFLVKLEQESLKKKTDMSKKYKKLSESTTCEEDFIPVTVDEEKAIQDFLASENKLYYKACARVKDSGGSAGNKRFIVFHKGGKEVFELKPLPQPAPDYQEQMPIIVRQELFSNAVNTYFSSSLKSEYYPVTLNNLPYQRRPLWAGNAEIKQEELTPKDLNEVMLYEAQTLGRLHKISNPLPLQMDVKDFERLLNEVERKWRAEFAE